MKATGSLSMVVCLFLVVGVWVVVVPMAKGDTTPSQCKEEKDLLMGACKNAVIIGGSPSAYCCQHVRVTHFECVCPYATPKVATLIPIGRTIKQIEGCGRSVPRNFKCGNEHWLTQNFFSRGAMLTRYHHPTIRRRIF